MHVFSLHFVEHKGLHLGHKDTQCTVEEAPKMFFSRARLRTIWVKRVWTWPRVFLHAYHVLQMINYNEEAAHVLFGDTFRELGVKYIWPYQGDVFGARRTQFLRLLEVRRGRFIRLCLVMQ